jgi:hypothetical protein
LAAATDAAVRRASPLNLGLDDDTDEPASSGDLFQKDLPALTAAANLVGGPWSAPGLSVQIGPTCAIGAPACVPLFGKPTADPHERRARALTWSLSHAAIVRAKASQSALVAALHERQGAPKGTIALVFAAPNGALDEGALHQLREEAARALAHLPANRQGASGSRPLPRPGQAGACP